MQRFILNISDDQDIPKFQHDLYQSIYLDVKQSKRILTLEGDKFFKNLSPEVKDQLMIIVQGKNTYDYLFRLNAEGKIHIGLRKFNYLDILDMDICWIEGVRFVFFRYLPKRSSGDTWEKWTRIIGKKYEVPPVKKPNIHFCTTLAEARECFKALNNSHGLKIMRGESTGQTIDLLAHDYETYDFPQMIWFQNLCVSFCNTLDDAWSIDIKAIRHSPDYEQWKVEYAEFMRQNEDRLMCFNAEFEPRCTYRETGEFFRCLDLWAWERAMDQKGSLKYFTQRNAAQPSWDDESEEVQDKITKIFQRFPSWEALEEYQGWIKDCHNEDEVRALATKEVIESHPNWTDEAINQYWNEHPTTEKRVPEGAPEGTQPVEVDVTEERRNAELDKVHASIKDYVDRKLSEWVDLYDPRINLTEEYYGSTWACVDPKTMMTYNALDSFYTLYDYVVTREVWGDLLERSAKVISNHKVLSSIFQLNGIMCNEEERRKLEHDYRYLYASCRTIFASGYYTTFLQETEKVFPNWKDIKLSDLFWFFQEVQPKWFASGPEDDPTLLKRQIVKWMIWAGNNHNWFDEEQFMNNQTLCQEVKDICIQCIKESGIQTNADGRYQMRWLGNDDLFIAVLNKIDELLKPDYDQLNKMFGNLDSKAYADNLYNIIFMILDRFFNISISDASKPKFNAEWFKNVHEWMLKPEDQRGELEPAANLFLKKFKPEGSEPIYDINCWDISKALTTIDEYRNGTKKLSYSDVLADPYEADLGILASFLPLAERKFMSFWQLNQCIVGNHIIEDIIKPIADVRAVDFGDQYLPDIEVESFEAFNGIADCLGKTNSPAIKNWLFQFMSINNVPFMSTWYEMIYNWGSEDGEEIREYTDYALANPDEWFKTRFKEYQKVYNFYPWIWGYDTYITNFRFFLGYKDNGITSIKMGSCLSENFYERFYYMSFTYCFFNTLVKELSTYVVGQNVESSEPFEFDNKLQSAWNDDDREDHKYVMIKPKWNVCTVETKRWSSGFHTFPPTCDVMWTWVPESEDRLFFYFDCSQAEVKTCAYSSKDPVLLQMYAEGKDIYVEMAKAMYKEKFDKSRHRKMFKSVVLGLLYGRGTYSIASACEVEFEEAKQLVELFKNMFPVMYEFIQNKVKFAVENEEIETLLGDRVYLRGGDNPATCGINYFVQGGTALMLGNGFYNCAYTAIKDKLGVLSKGMIHDAYLGTIFAKLIVLMYFYFKKMFTGFIEKTYNITYLYDFEIGVNFRDKIHCTIDKETGIMSLSGESIYVEKVANVILKYNPDTITNITEYAEEWDNLEFTVIKRKALMDAGMSKDEAKEKVKEDDKGKFRYGKPEDSLTGFYNRRNHRFSHESGYMIYPDSEMKLLVNKDYLNKCLSAVEHDDYHEFKQSF